MSQTQSNVMSAALRLPPAARAKLAERLVTSLDELARHTAEADLAIEIERRIDECESGKVRMIPLKTVLARTRARKKRP
jgi:putative addiction module component (TIGR02574 family)